MFTLDTSYWEVRQTKKTGRGVFAKKIIDPDTVIGDYRGVMIRAEDEDEDEAAGFYALFYNKEAVILPDPQKTGIHFVNHSCAANCDMYPYKGHTLFVSVRRIFPGEELSVPYALDTPEKADDGKPCAHSCHCGSPLCFGTMHVPESVRKECEKFLKKKQDKYSKKLLAPFGKEVPPLEIYPKNIGMSDPIYDILGSLTVAPQKYPDRTVPKSEEIRKRIKQTGRCLLFPNLNLCLWGTHSGLLISLPQDSLKKYLKY